MRGCFLLKTKSLRHCLGLLQLHLDNALRIGLETHEPSDLYLLIIISLHQELVIAFCANKFDVFNT